MKMMKTILRDYATQWDEQDPKFGKIEFIKMLRDLRTMRKQDAWGKPILRVGDVVQSLPLKDDPGTVVKILQVNANGAWVVAVKWFTWDGGRTTEEYITELELMSEA
jgi:hypothetical protein